MRKINKKLTKAQKRNWTKFRINGIVATLEAIKSEYSNCGTVEKIAINNALFSAKALKESWK